MKILLTGANGFLGFYLSDLLLSSGYELMATGRGDCRLPFMGRTGFSYQSMDFTDPFAVHDVFTLFKPEAVIHAGGMTRVDECETDQWKAYVTNVEGTVHLLMNAEEQKSFFLFVSTDFVFDGVTGMYKEEDKTNPVNYYGKTKVEAEEAVKEYEYGWAIARTILVYGKPQPGGNNILTTVKNKMERGEEYKLVSDQFRTPTFVVDLANGIMEIIGRKAIGIYHLSGADLLTPYDMGCKVAAHFNFDTSLLIKVIDKDFSQPGRRPPRTGFNIDKAKRELGYAPKSFEEGLALTFGN